MSFFEAIRPLPTFKYLETTIFLRKLQTTSFTDSELLALCNSTLPMEMEADAERPVPSQQLPHEEWDNEDYTCACSASGSCPGRQNRAIPIITLD